MKEHLETALKIKNCSDTAKRFFKDTFPEKVKPYMEIIRGVMEAKKIDTIPALLVISKTEAYESDGMVQMMFMAATVELIESENKK